MAGTATAQTDRFNFSTATIMVGPQSGGFAMTPTLNSLGLTKKCVISGEPSVVTLTQGIRNEAVSSITNRFNLKFSVDVFEYTAKNIAYGMSLNGALFTTNTAVNPVSAAAASAATSIKVAGDQTAVYVVGSWIFMQEGLTDQVHYGKVTTVSYGAPDTTISFAATPIPTGMSFSLAQGRVGLVNKIDANPAVSDNYFAVQVVGNLITDKRPIALRLPKCRITKGFNLKMDADAYDMMGYEFEDFVPLPTDPGYSTDYVNLFNVVVP